jgi:RNA polymerase sigma-70 factor (ECF subfamily)
MVNAADHPSDAVELALDLYGNDILRLAYSYLKTKEDAEDIVQDALIRLMQSGKVFEDEAHMKAWLIQVAVNLCKDKLKSAAHKRESAMPEGYDIAAAEESGKEEESDVFYHVMELPEKYRSVIHLYYYEEYSTGEIAELLGKKEATVRSLLKRGREKLKKTMKGEK